MPVSPEAQPVGETRKKQSKGRFPRLCISAARGSGGKTMLSLGLAKALSNKGIALKAFKKGPDYIDAAWLGLACGQPASNLDPFFLGPLELKAFFVRSLLCVAKESGNQPLALIEGNRGLYDGLDSSGSCSTARLARLLECPILLCLDCAKQTRTLAAMLQGLLNFEPGLIFCGVVLNNVGSARHERALREALKAALPDLPVFGVLPRLCANPLPERYMGLASQNLGSEAKERIEALSQVIASRLNLGAIIKAAYNAPPLELPACHDLSAYSTCAGKSRPNKARLSEKLVHTPKKSSASAIESAELPVQTALAGEHKPTIGYVEDAALWFYYPENLSALEHCGARLVRLSLLDAKDDPWPKLDGLYLGGGFPEDYLRELGHAPALKGLAQLAQAGLPIYAECGGMILLCQGLWREGQFWPLGGFFPLELAWSEKPQGLGYVQARVRRANPFYPRGLELRGHEFHYSSCLWRLAPKASAFCLSLSRGVGMARIGRLGYDGLFLKNTWASYMHILAPACPLWARAFVSLAAKSVRQREAQKF